MGIELTTVSNLVTQISDHLHSFTGFQEAVTYLTSDITNVALTIPVGHPTRITQGLIEIEDELIHVSDVGSTSVSAFPGFGRGANGSTQGSHVTNKKVTNDPLFPRIKIFDAIVACVLQIQPDLFRVKTAALFPASAVATTYGIPADVDRVLSVKWESLGPSKEWIEVKNWSIDHTADVVKFPTGKTLIVHESMQPGRNVQVVYAAKFTNPSSFSDLLTDLGLTPSMFDVLLYGVSYRMIQFLEPSRLQLKSVEQQARAQGIDVGGASKIAQQLYALYEARKREERIQLLKTYPQAIHRVTRY